VLDAVSLALEPGTLTQIRGGNGSGKSTLLRVAGGFSRPSRGRVRRSRGALGFVPDRALPPPRMTAGRYLDELGRLAGMHPAAVRASAGAIIERLGLVPGLDVPLGILSRGNQRKVLLAQCLMRPAELVVLDEPFTALDGATSAVLASLVQERVDEGCAVLVALHGSELGDAGRVFTLEAGHLERSVSAAPGNLVLIELAGPQPVWSTDGETQTDGATRYLISDTEVEEFLAAALAVHARVLRVHPAVEQ
jgi:ABC-type multidrug transport system ATPase subunit